MTDEPAPVLRVVRGEPTRDELAALVTVLAAVGRPAAEPPARRSPWGDPAVALRGMAAPGPGAWVRSAWVAGVRTNAGW